MIITEHQLSALDPCEDGFSYWLCQEKEDLAEFMVQAWKDDHTDYAHWLFVRFVPRELYLKYAIYSAELVLHIFEHQFPDDNRPREAIEAAKACLRCNSDSNIAAAADAAEAASHSGYLFDGRYCPSGRAAYGAAKSASTFNETFTVANVARGAVHASYAANSAAISAYLDCNGMDRKKSKKKMQKEIIDYGIKILREYEGKDNE